MFLRFLPGLCALCWDFAPSAETLRPLPGLCALFRGCILPAGAVFPAGAVSPAGRAGGQAAALLPQVLQSAAAEGEEVLVIRHQEGKALYHGLRQLS